MHAWADILCNPQSCLVTDVRGNSSYKGVKGQQAPQTWELELLASFGQERAPGCEILASFGEAAIWNWASP